MLPSLVPRGAATRRSNNGFFLGWCPFFKSLLALEGFAPPPIATETLVAARRLPPLEYSPLRWTTLPRTHSSRGVDVLFIRLRCEYDERLEVWICEVFVPPSAREALYAMVPAPSPYMYKSVIKEGQGYGSLLLRADPKAQAKKRRNGAAVLSVTS